MIDKKNITGIILAGGKSSRVGTEKGLLKLNGKTFISRIIKTIKPFVSDTIIVSGNSEYDVYQLKRAKDIMIDRGPLCGILSGLMSSKTDLNLILSCDVPTVNDIILNELLSIKIEDYDVVQLNANGNDIPLIALYRKSCIPLFEKLVNMGDLKLLDALDKLKVKSISLKPEFSKYVRNINTLEQLNMLEHELKD